VNSGAGGFDGDMSRSRGYGFGSGAAGAGAGAARTTNRPGWKSGDWICTRCVLLNLNPSTLTTCFMDGRGIHSVHESMCLFSCRTQGLMRKKKDCFISNMLE
jgi:hypothetical protein